MKSATERSAWTSLAYAAGALALEVIIGLILAWTPPPWLAGSIPVAVGILRAAVVILRTQSADVTGYPPELAARVHDLLALEAERDAQAMATQTLDFRLDASRTPIDLSRWPPDAPPKG